MTKKALVIGASGLVGSSLSRLLFDDETYDKIHILVRKSTNWIHDKLVEHVIDFEQLPFSSGIFQVDSIFCCLGTTINKAKTKEAFYRVDHDYVLDAGKLTAENNAKFLVISSMGANPKSMFFYSRVKGEMEQDLQKLKLPSLHIFRPSLLLGDRSEFRLSERLAAPFSRWFLKGPLKKYKPNQAQSVAQAMIHVSKEETLGFHIYDSTQIEKIAKRTEVTPKS
ncbi:oxidoreductase [Shimazuella sp. AN120528]|uniref:oxidoreductase n=1 Tax=Shimazuella soli TaxID=1892854 RepID=UPI001F0DCBB9|nr:oxidoreductase [Shimazuella soli]MCH5585535.1 oxidoreductase [Shimazuella soli]